MKSNREAGYGRADVLIIPKDRSQLGVIMEFKRCYKGEELEPFAKEALAQIERRQYRQELQSLGISKTLALGISFFGKEMCLKVD